MTLFMTAKYDTFHDSKVWHFHMAAKNDTITAKYDSLYDDKVGKPRFLLGKRFAANRKENTKEALINNSIINITIG